MALKSIPASQIVNVVPSAIGQVGSSYQLNGVLFTVTAPYATKQYSDSTSIASDLGEDSDAYKLAVVYFNGTTQSSKKPSVLHVVRYNEKDLSAKTIGATRKSQTLAELQAIKGSLNITIDGTAKTANIDLPTATSWSSAATIIATDLSATVTFDTKIQSFIVSSATTGQTSSIGYATGDTADALGLSSSAGAQVDNDVKADTVLTAMARLNAYTLNYGGVTVDSTFSVDELKQFIQYTSQQNHYLWFVAYTLEQQALIANNASCLGSWIKENSMNDTTLIYGDITEAGLALGYMASLDFSKQNGRATLDFRRTSSGLPARVTDLNDAKALESNGYTYYGAFATRTDRLVFFRNGVVSGSYLWADSYLIQLRLTTQLQSAALNGLVQVGYLPYGADGKSLARLWFETPIKEQLNFGGIQTGVILDEQQKALVNSYTDRFDVAQQLFTAGYVLLIEDATTEVRQARGSFPCTLLYTDGQTVQTINLASQAVL